MFPLVEFTFRKENRKKNHVRVKIQSHAPSFGTSIFMPFLQDAACVVRGLLRVIILFWFHCGLAEHKLETLQLRFLRERA